MQGLVIFIIVVVISAVIGGITQLLKKAQQAEQEKLAQRRAASRRTSGDRPPAGDIDRFLEEIDKLRRKGGVEPPVARPTAAPPVPTIAPALPPRLADPGFAIPPQAPRALPRLEDLPVATPTPRAAPVVARRAVPGSRKPQPTTEFGRQFVGMIGTKQSVAMAVVLQEVLGPPKCKTRGI